MPRATTASASAAAPRYALEIPTAGPSEIAGSGAACKSIFSVGKELGRGEQGTVYEVPAEYKNRAGSDWTVVMKVSKFTGETADEIAVSKAKWIEEVKISKELGDMETAEGLRVAPKIISAWICGGKGYIIMERMKTDLRKVKTDARVGEKVTMAGEEVQKNHIDNAPFDIQDDYVVLLEYMIDKGFVHMDNHPGNLGILTYTDGDHGVLFDFGFTRKYSDLNEMDKFYALAFSIAQIIEHTPYEELSGSFLFMIFANIMLQSTLPAVRRYEWGSRSPMISDDDLKDFMKAHKLRRVTETTLPIAAPRGMNHPEFYVGAKLYCYLLMFKQPQRYKWADYGKIYDIRQSVALTAGENYTVPAAAAAAAAPKRAAATKKVHRGKREEVAVENAPMRVTRRGAAAAAAAAAEEDIAVTSVRTRAARARARAAEYAAANAGIAARVKLTKKKRGGRRGCELTRRRR